MSLVVVTLYHSGMETMYVYQAMISDNLHVNFEILNKQGLVIIKLGELWIYLRRRLDCENMRFHFTLTL